LAKRELEENLSRAQEDKTRTAQEIVEIENELTSTMAAIKTLGLVTLKLEGELEQSWELVKKTSAAEDIPKNKQEVK